MKGYEGYHLANLTPKELREGGYNTAILPVGATEYHGDHLPYSTDTIMATSLAERFAEELGTAVILPPIAVAMSLHLINWPWTLSIRPETLTAVVVDLAESLLAHGITRLLAVSAHDGNPGPIEAAAREVSDRHGMTIALFGGWQSLSRRLLTGSYDIDLDHGGQSEMSIVLYAAPELAHPERAVDLPNQGMDHAVRVLGPFSNVVPHGYSGQPSKGSAEEGHAILDAVCAEVVPFLRELAAHGWVNGSWMSGISAD
jgi:creatinine amidohydrolase